MEYKTGSKKDMENHKISLENLALGLTAIYGWLGNNTETAIMLILHKKPEVGFNELQEEIRAYWQNVSHSPSSISRALKNLKAVSQVRSNNKNERYSLTGVGRTAVDLIVVSSRVGKDDDRLPQETRKLFEKLAKYTKDSPITVAKHIMPDRYHKTKDKFLIASKSRR